MFKKLSIKEQKNIIIKTIKQENKIKISSREEI